MPDYDTRQRRALLAYLQSHPDEVLTAREIAAACCSQGFEFLLRGEYRFPDDYPLQNEVITVTGVFDTYYEDGVRYSQLIDAVME